MHRQEEGTTAACPFGPRLSETTSSEKQPAQGLERQPSAQYSNLPQLPSVLSLRFMLPQVKIPVGKFAPLSPECFSQVVFMTNEFQVVRVHCAPPFCALA
jgi:hypothetical protein